MNAHLSRRLPSTLALALTLTLAAQLAAQLTAPSAAHARPLSVTFESLKVAPADKSGAAWDDDGTPPDLQVRVKVGGRVALISPVFANTLEITTPLSVSLSGVEEPLEVFIYDVDGELEQKVSALRVHPRPEDIGAGSKSYRASNLEELRVSLSAQEAPDPLDEELSAEEVEGSTELAEEAREEGAQEEFAYAEPVDPWEGVGAYTPRPSALPAPTPADLSASRLPAALFANSAARALYAEAARLRAAGFTIEAKETLARLIAAHPQSVYALKARRDLF